MRTGSSRTANEPQLKTRIRRWRRYQPPTNLECGSDSVAETTSSGQLNRRLRKRIGLEFINTAHPHDATSSTAISSIRSHAARNIHASHRASASHPKGSGKGRRTQMDTNENSLLSIDWPVHLMVPVYSGLLHCFARPMTKFEHFLLDYYAASVIPDAHLWCHHGDEETVFIEGVRLYWLPFVVTDSGLLAGIFLSSCRNLALREHRPQANHEYSQLAMMYKLECIRSVNEAIAAEGPIITETTIAKTLLLCADEFMCDDLNASALHFEGMNNMIKLKGGLSNVGVNGFLRKALKWCNLENILKISLPNYNPKSTRDTI
ncbi:hypothetical protein CFAM422_010389 [Trichoderma lentiforme]|uniref:Uncharacterized protein n=1 Tax=Trichoderma lentiforme TaxID=1567552 RepID=A0A9P5CAE8_9HYPO|nr:hypothetical protein CFAM422_010389 [Trichoderma lentiforme]